MIVFSLVIIAIPVILIIALFSRKGFTVSRETKITQPVTVVYHYLTVLENQAKYHKQLMIDADMKGTSKGTSGELGSYYAWESKNPKVGKASEKITSLHEPDRIEVAITFEKPFKSQAVLLMELSPVSSSKETLVRWTFFGNEHPYYLLRVGHLLFRVKRAVTKDLEQTLDNLKKLLEKQ